MGVRLKQKFSFSNFCPGRGLNPGPRSLMAVNVTTRLRRHPPIYLMQHGPFLVHLVFSYEKAWSQCASGTIFSGGQLTKTKFTKWSLSLKRLRTAAPAHCVLMLVNIPLRQLRNSCCN